MPNLEGVGSITVTCLRTLPVGCDAKSDHVVTAHPRASLAALTRLRVASKASRPWPPSRPPVPWSKRRADDQRRIQLVKEGLEGDGLTFHGLRHTVGTLLRGCTDDLDLIRRWLGQETLHMAMHHSETADTSEAMLTAVGRFEPLG